MLSQEDSNEKGEIKSSAMHVDCVNSDNIFNEIIEDSNDSMISISTTSSTRMQITIHQTYEFEKMIDFFCSKVARMKTHR